jgi:trehalose-phosphatase
MPLTLRDHVDALVAAILETEPVLLCTDFDGTLVPLHDDPRSCLLDGPTREVLAALHAPPRRHVAIVSGRRLADVRAKVGVDTITYAGNHGLEIEGSGMMFREPAAVACHDVLRALADDLAVFLAGIDGARLEWKGLSLTVHFRQVRTDAVPAVRAVVARAVSRMSGPGHLRIHGGKDVLEIRPNVDWDKGRAVEWLADRLGCGPRQRIFIGDDETDEDAFAACHRGITIRVGHPDAPTNARFVATVDDVRGFLTRLAGSSTIVAPRPVADSAGPLQPECRGR